MVETIVGLLVTVAISYLVLWISDHIQVPEKFAWLVKSAVRILLLIWVLEKYSVLSSLPKEEITMRMNKKGFVIEGAALVIIAIMALFILPSNPVSNALGVGVRPNKTVQVEKVELLVDKQGNPIKAQDGTYMIHRSVSDTDTQQHVTFLEWLRSLPILMVLLMGSGIVFPGVTLFLHRARQALMANTKNMVVSIDRAMDNISDPLTKKIIYNEMEKTQDSSTKDLVDKIQGKK